MLETSAPDVGLDHADSLGLLHRQTTVLELIAAGNALPDVLAAVTRSLEELIPGSRCSVLLFDTATRTLRHGAAPTLPPEYSDTPVYLSMNVLDVTARRAAGRERRARSTRRTAREPDWA